MKIDIRSMNHQNPVLVHYPNPNRNIFLMTRFRQTQYHQQIAQTLHSILANYALNLIKADEQQYDDELWTNVRLCMDASMYGIAVIEQIDQRDFNPNIGIELGYMLGQNKRCLLLKELRVPTLPVDLMGHLYKEFDVFSIQDSITDKVIDWLRDLGIAKKPGEKMLAFVSMGGTCRCAMAKAITIQLLKQKYPHLDIRVESRARGNVSLPTASYSARETIIKLTGEDLLKDHKPITGTLKFWEEADLILVMERALKKNLPPEKTYLFKEFFGLAGDVSDPWPDEMDDDSTRRYLSCGYELKNIIGENIEKIVSYLEAI